MEIGVSLKPYESIFDRMIEIETGSRAAFRGESVIDPDNAHTRPGGAPARADWR
jgi:hypothetical protein